MYLRYIASAMRDGSKGAIVISVDDEGVHMGIAGLKLDGLRYALCAAMNHSFEAGAAPERLFDLVEIPGPAPRAAVRLSHGENMSADDER